MPEAMATRAVEKINILPRSLMAFLAAKKPPSDTVI